ncbi:MAG TPA: hypothetical protein VNF71_04515 [Acidimicrobiales bacterium]|nr:hypothetical protein [Acidimicrobiales bacterium]
MKESGVVADLPTFHSPKDYLDFVASEGVTPEHLRALAQCPYDFVVVQVAGHPLTPPDVLVALMPRELRTWNDSARLIALIRNPSMPPEELNSAPELILPRLHVRDDHKAFEAGVALSQRSGVHEDVLIRLVSDPRATTEFRKVLARDSSHHALRERLASDRSERVRRAAERSPVSDT